MMQYNANYVFNQLALINRLRNRVAHHEPICFVPTYSRILTRYVGQIYGHMKELFQWMDIDMGTLLHGLDCVESECMQIDLI